MKIFIFYFSRKNECIDLFKDERLANTNIQQNPTGPPISIPPKLQLTKAERRATQVINSIISIFFNYCLIF